jgi:acetyltransferase
MTHDMAAQLTQIDYDREMAFVLADPGAGEIHAVVRLSADPDGERTEFAIVVEDAMARRGIGRLLMQHLSEYAASRGIREIFGHVLTDNLPMLGLCHGLGFQVSVPAREGVLQLSLDPCAAKPRPYTPAP